MMFLNGQEQRSKAPHTRAGGLAAWPRCPGLSFVQSRPVGSPCCEAGSGRHGGQANGILHKVGGGF